MQDGGLRKRRTNFKYHHGQKAHSMDQQQRRQSDANVSAELTMIPLGLGMFRRLLMCSAKT